MARERIEKRWGLAGRKEPAAIATVDSSPEADAERLRCSRDCRYFYSSVIARTRTDRRTGQAQTETLGRFHDYMLDFLSLEELAALSIVDNRAVYSPLIKYLPEKVNGLYQERWVYWPTLDCEPEVQDGPDGPVSTMFRNRFWQGLLIRVIGDGLVKCLLTPRGHLKSTVGTQTRALWKIVRDPSERNLIVSQVYKPLARDFIADVKQTIEGNARFKRLWGELQPRPRELPWCGDFFTVRCETRRGKEPTLRGVGVDSGMTGGHYEGITFDDVVGEKNYVTPDQRAMVRRKIMELQAVADPGSSILDIGTPWAEDDGHSLFLHKDSQLNHYTSFMVATVLDGDTTVPVPRMLTPLGYGKPIWPEKFTLPLLNRLRAGITDDTLWFGFYYCQFTGTSRKTFHPDWKTWYEGSPETVAKELKLNLYIGVDTASGQDEQRGDLDLSAAMVWGQRPDRMASYLLGGFNERLTAAEIASQIVDLVLHWKAVAAGYGGSIRCGAEKTAYTNFLFTALDGEFRRRGVESSFGVEPIPMDVRSKPEKTRVLAAPYSHHMMLWPRTLIVSGVHRGPYDLMTDLQAQWDNYGGGQLANDDLLDAHARAFELTPPAPYMEQPTTPDAPRSRDGGAGRSRTVTRGRNGLDRYKGPMRQPWER